MAPKLLGALARSGSAPNQTSRRSADALRALLVMRSPTCAQKRREPAGSLVTLADVDELMKRAWEAVQKAGVSEAAQAVALQEAVAYLREEDGGGGGKSESEAEQTRRKTRGGGRGPSGSKSRTGDLPDQGTFFERLAHESGIDAAHLKEVLQLDGDTVHVLAATKDLGSNKAEQARNIVALVASARLYGLGEDPVSANAVRAEVQKKRAFDEANFGTGHLGRMKGFKFGSNRAQIIVMATWLAEFKAAVHKVRGTSDDDK